MKEVNMGIAFTSVTVTIPEGHNVILGQAHFIKTVDDLAEAIVSTGAKVKFGVAFCEASPPCLIRSEGTDNACIDLAVSYAKNIGAGHSFCIVLGEGSYPINMLDRIKNCMEVCTIFCATANPLEVLIAETSQGRAIIGVVDGYSPKGIETEADKQARKSLLRKIGYRF
jgi:uncharacterized protein